jgi:hypothetical protein
MSDNPYQPPLSDALPPGGAETQAQPPYKLFASWHVTLATFLGSLTAGGIVMAINFWRLNRTGAAIQAVVISFLATVAVIVLTYNMPDLPGLGFVYLLPQLVVIHVLSEKIFREPFSEHRRQHGRWSSAWAAAGIGLLTGIVLGVLLIGGIMLVDTYAPEWLPVEE